MKKTLLLKTMLLLCAILFGTSAWADEEVTLWSEGFSSYSADDVPSGGAFSYVCVDNGSNKTKIYDEALAGGTTPELLIGKSGGSFTATIPLDNIEGDLTLTFKTNYQKIGVSTTTTGITGGVEEKKEGEHTVTFSGVTTSMTEIVIKFYSFSSNVRLDDILLKGPQSTSPSAALSVTSLDFGEVEVGKTKVLNFTVTPANLTGALTIASDNDKYEVSPTSIAQDATGAQTITVTAAPTALDDDMEGSITISGGGLAANKTVTLAATTYQVANVTLVGDNGTFEVNDETVTSLTSRVGSTATIKAVPAQGYYFTSWAADGATPASSTDAETEFTFTSATVTLTATFTAIPTHTVTWSVNGVETTNEVKEGAAVTFPANPADLGGKKFMGWTETAIAGTTDVIPTFVTSAEMGNSDVTYYAVFATAEGTGEDEWIATPLASLTTSDVFVIVGKNASGYFAMSNDKGTGTAPDAVEVTVDGNKITSTIAAKIKWNISGNATDGYTFYPNGSTTTWLYCISQNNGVRVGDSENNTFVISNNYLYNSGQERYLGIYNSQDWRCYTSINSNIKGQSFAFYKKTEGTTYSAYCTSITVPVTISDAGYATFSNASAVDFSSNTGLSVYYVSSTTGNKAEMVEISSKKVPASTGVLLKGAAGNYSGAVTTGVDALDGNLLCACVDGYDATDDNEIYILANGGSGVGFYPIKGGTSLGAGKAYIGGGDVNAKCLTLSFGSETTAINGVEEVAPANVKTRKVVKNGRLVIETANGEFTIDGARVK